jgi:hypothetical protein
MREQGNSFSGERLAELAALQQAIDAELHRATISDRDQAS